MSVAAIAVEKEEKREKMMPKIVCKECNREFWGWGAYHSFKKGIHLICPDCHGHLAEKKEPKLSGIIERLLKGSAA